MRLHFTKFVCQKEIIGTFVEGDYAPDAPPGSTTVYRDCSYVIHFHVIWRIIWFYNIPFRKLKRANKNV